ncbi:hydroxypyruvate isomerase family protein [Salegentibacter chungangensis]|uniref:Hydroxypyruvate isomerase family protein n=1 Tax=Salegentibacter chungangensis TaxID=1335724 RepID=A0ABW3NVP3_9FLAO
MEKNYNRRDVLKSLTLGSAVLSIGGVMSSFAAINMIDERTIYHTKGNIKHSVCRWPYQDIPLEVFAAKCRNLGISAIDLLKPEEWDTVEKHGLVCSMATADFIKIEEGFNDKKNHKSLQEHYRKLIADASARGVKNVICFSGNRNGMNDETGLKNCATGLAPLLDFAREGNVNLVMELLNSKVDHKDYMADHTDWGVALAKKLNRPNFKLLYDIYHMQIMEGDIIRTIRDNHQFISHYHTGGVPGRNEIDETQELNYSAIMKAISETGFDGYVAQEFIPTKENKIEALKTGIEICDV